jgi:hypothetical protein
VKPNVEKMIPLMMQSLALDIKCCRIEKENDSHRLLYNDFIASQVRVCVYVRECI